MKNQKFIKNSLLNGMFHIKMCRQAAENICEVCRDFWLTNCLNSQWNHEKNKLVRGEDIKYQTIPKKARYIMKWDFYITT